MSEGGALPSNNKTTHTAVAGVSSGTGGGGRERRETGELHCQPGICSSVKGILTGFKLIYLQLCSIVLFQCIPCMMVSFVAQNLTRRVSIVPWNDGIQ